MRLISKQARLQISRRGAVLGVGVSGLVTAGTSAQIRLLLAPMMQTAMSVWIDYTKAAVAVTDLELQEMVLPIAAGARSIPMAWAVADEGAAELWSRQVVRLAFHGQRRFVALGVDAAVRWAEQEAAQAIPPATR